MELTGRVSDLRVEVADMKARIEQTPDEDFIVKVVMAAFTLLAAISLFRDRLVHFTTDLRIS